MRPHFLQVTCPVWVDATVVEGGRGRAYGSGMITPTRQVIIPVTKRAPPPINTGRSTAHANTLPESIVRRHELAAAAVRTGPRTTMIIPRMKMSDLKVLSQRVEPLRSLLNTGRSRGFLRLCYWFRGHM